MDNTWSGGVFFKPFEHGVDVSVQAGTKYIVGHSDVMMGLITTTEEHWRTLRTQVAQLAAPSGPDDVYLALRGLRTIKVRMQRHQESGLTLARWLESRDEVERVMHPGLPSDPGHKLWQRDFTGACGLFGVALDRRYSADAVAAMVDGLELYGNGASWGGFESLLTVTNPGAMRTVTKWDSGPTIRIHTGLEDTEDLIADLEKGFQRLNAKK
jgi:cystathionine beta-lyase